VQARGLDLHHVLASGAGAAASLFHTSRRRVPTRRSQVGFMRRAWTALRRILAPVAWKTASKEAGEVRSAVAEQEPDALEPLAKAEGKVAGLLHGPLTRGNGSDAAETRK